jgi:hypothetical protein
VERLAKLRTTGGEIRSSNFWDVTPLHIFHRELKLLCALATNKHNNREYNINKKKQKISPHKQQLRTHLHIVHRPLPVFELVRACNKNKGQQKRTEKIP